MSLTPGTRLGPYEIVAPIGAGGMGEVYRARDAKLNRLVALKVLPTSVAHDPERRERFTREAQAVAALNHPGIVTIHSVEDAGNAAFITMELIEGRPLSGVIPPHGLPLKRALDIGVAVLDAVAAAHQKGILHRDLKPANVMIGEGEHDGRVKVLDFGLAKLIGTDANRSADTTALATVEGLILGTVAYMSPEQAEGKPVDARSDLFSMGVVLYEMVAGQRPFRGGSNVAILSSILKDTPAPVTQSNASLPSELDRIVRRALAKDPERRYQTARDFRNDIEELKTATASAPLAAAPKSVATMRLWFWPVFAVGVLAAVGASVWALRHAAPSAPAPALSSPVSAGKSTRDVSPTTPAPPAGAASAKLQNPDAPAGAASAPNVLPPGPTTSQLAMSSPTLTPLTSTGTAILPTISPDGKYVVYVESVGDEQSVWVKQIANGGTTRIVPPEKNVGIAGITVTPDGSFVDYVRTPRELWRVPFLGGPARKIIDRVITAPGWSPDGKQMAYLLPVADGAVQSTNGPQRPTQLLVADANGDHSRVVATLSASAYALGYTTVPDVRPVWMPDGKSIAVLGYTGTVATGTHVTVTAVDVATGRESVLFASTPDEGVTDLRMGFALGPDGRSFILNLQTPTRPAELLRLSLPRGELTRLTNDLAMYFGASRAGDTVVTTRYERRTSFWVMDAAGRGARQVGREISASPARALAWAGTRLVYSALVADGTGVWSTDVVSGVSQFIVSTDSWARISTTADGRTLYYAKGGDGVWTSGADGSHPAKVPDADGTEPAVTPDGSRLFLGTTAIDLRTGARLTVNPTFTGHDSLSVSPDGRFVTYASNGEQVIVPVAGGEPVARLKLPRLGGAYPHFTPDGQGMAYVDRTGLSISIQPISGGEPRRLVEFPDRPILQFCWSPDGKQLAVSRAQTISDLVLLRGVR